MKTTILIFSVLFIGMLSSCKLNEHDIDSKSSLIGTWYLDEEGQINNERVITYVRTTDNINLKANLSFEESNNYFMRTPMSSFCMTPPISFINIAGMWSKSDNIISLKNQFSNVNYRIIFIDNNSLKISVIN